MELTFEVLKGQIEPTEQNKEVVQVIPVVKDMQALTTQELINMALEKGVLKQTKSWFYFLDRKILGKAPLIAAIETDMQMKEHIEKLIAEKA